MKTNFVLFAFGKLLPESGSALDLDPHLSKMLDLDQYPDLHTINMDPKN
jgi:hypothetical protein